MDSKAKENLLNSLMLIKYHYTIIISIANNAHDNI